MHNVYTIIKETFITFKVL